jgi:putative flippase GtrA
MDLNDFLMWAASSGGASVIASFILERIPAFQALKVELKKWYFFGACSALSVGSFCVLTYVPAEVLNQIAPFFALIAVNFASVFVGEAFHKFFDRQAKG